MQENEQNISPIKQRILQFVDYLKISKREFYSITGISRGTLDNKSGIDEKTLTKLFATYNIISVEWVILGKGRMLINIDQPKNVDLIDDNIDIINMQKITISSLHKLAETQEKYIKTLENKIKHYESIK